MQVSGNTGGTSEGGAAAELPMTGPLRFYLGNGRDGVLNFDGVNDYPAIATKSGNTYTLITAVIATSLTVAAGVTLETTGWFLIVRGTLTNNGSITNIAGTAASGFSPGTVPTIANSGLVAFRTAQAGAAGGTTGAGTPGLASYGLGGISGAGGAAGANAGGASGGKSSDHATAMTTNQFTMAPFYRTDLWARATGNQSFTGGSGGGGGGSVSAGARGGGGGAGGGLLHILTGALVHAGVIDVSGRPGAAAPGVNAGGGGGGGGGWVVINTLTVVTGSGTYNATGGAGGAGNGTGLAGSAGAAGTVTTSVWPA